MTWPVPTNPARRDGPRKLEIRISKSEGSAKPESEISKHNSLAAFDFPCLLFASSSFEFPSDFGFSIFEIADTEGTADGYNNL
jgi:hypothetical protein